MVLPAVDAIAIVDDLRQHGLIQHGRSPKKDKTLKLIIILLLLCFYVARVRISFTSNSRAVFLDEWQLWPWIALQGLPTPTIELLGAETAFWRVSWYWKTFHTELIAISTEEGMAA
jgi:hypothetical protein